MVKAKHKKVSSSQSTGLIPQPEGRSASKPSEKMNPYFSFYLLQKNFCIMDCNKDEKAGLADTLKKLSSMTWAELRQNGRHKLGYEKIDSKSLKVPIPPDLIKENVTFLVFRFSAKKAMIGYRESNIFHILFLDPKYKAYSHS